MPPGKYTRDVIDPGTHVLWERLPKVELTDPAACVSEDITLRYNGRIRGQLLDHTGKPAANVPISAQGPATQGALRAVSNARGEYEITGVQAGRYLVVVNHATEGGPDADSPIPTTYYPGVATEAAAKPVTMTRSAVVAQIDFQLPKPIPVFTVTGVLKRKRQPVAGVHVKFNTELGPQYGRGTGAHTDASGRFTFRDIAGAKVSLEVCRPDAGPQSYKTACPHGEAGADQGLDRPTSSIRSRDREARRRRRRSLDAGGQEGATAGTGSLPRRRRVARAPPDRRGARGVRRQPDAHGGNRTRAAQKLGISRGHAAVAAQAVRHHATAQLKARGRLLHRLPAAAREPRSAWRDAQPFRSPHPSEPLVRAR